ncbi:unnamed protein product [Rotaria magnacalcarata]|uniref:Uncharacterized protein n=1 Tax=Rotaria magnacalcarata TaxID=392030 RepID=A0A819PIK1_9BILA|nr:unnamed protein product [Rotaria magnacalcarata]CAF1682956.1 unnamed protein product [Rotaria magnacalcarata]CAF2044280.1 unnamed protein product [Rotaria magnacalcarata]CAF2123240.1 unnamed protein product [Rotaria magnacalcarata]CAF3860757.1 unnamed protein product [Rotaria magnacalcarata]
MRTRSAKKTTSVKAVKPKVDWRRPKATKGGSFCSEPQQDLEEYANNLEFEVNELYHLLDREMSGRQKLEDSVDHLMKMSCMQERALVELKRDVRRLRAMPDKIDVALDWVVRGVALVQEHLQGQHQELPTEDNEDDNFSSH